MWGKSRTMTKVLSGGGPLLLRQWRPVEQVAPTVPVGHEAVHERREAFAVVAFDVMGHLVDDDVLQAVGVLLGQLDVEPEVSRLAVAGAPLGLQPGIRS